MSVAPQPDEAAIHFIPAASNHDLVAVLLRTAAVTEPRCMAHTLPAAHYHSVTINGRTGRLRLPYQVRRGTEQAVRLRDGDCLHADVGPWGPPPPTPASSFAGRLVLPGFLTRLFLATVLSRPNGYFLGAYAMIEATDAWDFLQVGSFPWRRDRSTATLRLVGGPTPCRCLLLCPWTGRHSSIQGTADTTIEQVQSAFQQALYGQAQLQPVWPSLKRNCLALVPQVPSDDIACVVGLLAGVTYPCVARCRISSDDLTRVLQHRIGGNAGPVRLPPALKVRRSTCHTELLQLRDGDVIDIVDPERPAVVADVRHSVQLKDQTLWTRDFRIGACLTVRLWFPHLRQPILTWLRDGEHWDSDALTFRPHFAARYSGRWVPVPWAPGRTTHLVQASDAPNRVATLINASDGVRGMFLVPQLTGCEIADVLHTSSTAVCVLGLPATLPTAQLALRDGDVVWDSLLYGEPEIGWATLEEEVSGVSLVGLAALMSRHSVALACLTGLVWSNGVAAMRRSTSSERSRSRSPSPLSSAPWIGRWRPDAGAPFEHVTHQGHVDYRVLCPFRGWSPFYYVRPSAPADDLLNAVTDFTGNWPTGCTLVGASHSRLPLVALPKSGHRLVTCVVTSGVHKRAFLYPATACYHDLHSYCHRIFGLADTQLSCHPAIRQYALLSTACFTLRHGDAFDMYPAESHHDFRATPRATFKYLGDLHHHHAWHQEFRVLYGGRVKVWHHDERHEYTCRHHKIVDGSIWTPFLGRCRAPRSLPGNTPWVPSHCVDDGWCHFAQASESGRVGVLLQEEDRPARCVSVVAPGNIGIPPPGWQLRSDIRSRLEGTRLRDGDVLVPIASSARQTRISVALLGFFCHNVVCRSLQLAALLIGAQGMVLPPVDRELARPAHVGRYPWRMPRPMRVFHQAGGTNVTGQLISPFVEPSHFQVLQPELSVDDAYIALSGSEPAWFRDLMPIWPSQGQQCITFTPVPPCGELVCVLLVSREWQQAILLPVRADLSWVSGYVRRTHRGSVVAIRGPISTLRARRSIGEMVTYSWLGSGTIARLLLPLRCSPTLSWCGMLRFGWQILRLIFLSLWFYGDRGTGPWLLLSPCPYSGQQLLALLSVVLPRVSRAVGSPSPGHRGRPPPRPHALTLCTSVCVPAMIRSAI